MSPTRTLAALRGHGTLNDFVLLDDPDGRLDLTPALVRALADRRGGVGGDGVIRLVRDGDGWLMDYRNADGSVAQMCGNGVRVTAALLERLGRWDGTGVLNLGTRAGVKHVRRVDPPTLAGPQQGDWYAVDMGPWRLRGGEQARSAGFDAQVRVAGLAVERPALSLDLGNPHTVLALAGVDELAAADLSVAPKVTPVPDEGTNVELVVPGGEENDELLGLVGRLRMRVHERGVGETLSCGTGACAAALAVRVWAGQGAPDRWLVEVPGGTLLVSALSGSRVELAGPAVLVAQVQVDLDALPSAEA